MELASTRGGNALRCLNVAAVLTGGIRCEIASNSDLTPCAPYCIEIGIPAPEAALRRDGLIVSLRS